MPSPPESFRSRAPSAAFVSLAVYVAGCVILLFRMLSSTGGHFTYSLDDPYIHLALAERIRHGLYGLNAGEPASPSSSILWPFLFVPFAGTALTTYLPLCLNFLLGSAVAWLLGSVVDRSLSPGVRGREMLWYGRALAVLLVFATNMLGLTFTGLEQLLELLLCVCCAYLCIAAAQNRPIPAWTIAAATVLPMIRYEAMLITFASVVVLWFAGRRRTAALVLVLGMLPVALFSLFLHHLGLPPIPISVVVKGATVALTGGRIHGLLLIAKGALKTMFVEPERAGIGMLTLVCFVLLVLQIRRTPRRPVALAAFAVLTAVAGIQLCFGPFGWLFRYEIYTIGFILPVLLSYGLGSWQEADTPEASSARPATATAPWLPAVIVCILTLIYLPALHATVNASQSVWREQGQMSRLMHDFYKGPVAINDLGLVAYRRDPNDYVLDLVGLGSPEVFNMLVHHSLKQHLGDLTREHRIGLVAVYPEWMKAIAPEWRPLAKLCAAGWQWGPASPRVMFYSTPDTDLPAMQATLASFRATLPPGSTMELNPHDSSMTCK